MILRFFSSKVWSAVLAAAVIVGCGGKVVVDVPGAGGGGVGGIGGLGGTGGVGGCPGSAFSCLQFCGSDFFPANAECIGGAWVCPEGTVDPQTCTVDGCCTSDFDCGDEIFVPCVNGVCKQPVLTGCWSDALCGVGTCVDVFVCPCGQACDQPDVPGICVGVP